MGAFQFLAVAIFVLFGHHNSQAEKIVHTCPTGWTNLGVHCFRSFNDTNKVQTWPEAQSICNGHGGSLAVIDDFSIASDVGSFAYNHSAEEFWIGLNRFGKENNNPWVWGHDMPASTYSRFWANNNPDKESGDCVYLKRWIDGYGDFRYSGKQSHCYMKRDFVCQRKSCPEGHYHCQNGACLQNMYVCDGVDDCRDYSDEFDCDEKCHYKLSATVEKQNFNSPNYPGKYDPSTVCRWTIEGPIGSNIFIEFLNINTETADIVQVLVGALTEDFAVMKGKIFGVKQNVLYNSFNNYMIIKFFSDHTVSDHTVQRRGFTANYWSQESGLSSMVELVATNSQQFLLPPTFLSQGAKKVYLGHQDLVWVIQSKQRTQIITLEAEKVSLAEDDMIIVYDGDSPMGALLATYTAEISGPQYVFSTGTKLYIIMRTGDSSHSGEIKFSYKQGCDVTYDSDSGCVSSPGYPNALYANSQSCTWAIKNPKNMPATLHFEEDWDFEERTFTKDYLQVFLGEDGVRPEHSDEGFKSSNLKNKFSSDDGKFFLRFTTNSVVRSKGFKACFSIKCPDHSFANTRVLSGSYGIDYRSKFKISCASGYFFAQEEFFRNTNEVEMECLINGKWNTRVIPQCMPVFCGRPPLIDHGYLKKAEGLTYNMEAQYACFPGHNIGTYHTIRCQANAEWQVKPTCSVAQCPVIANIANGQAELHDGDGTEFGSIYFFSCEEGYLIDGAPRILCTSEGAWTEPPPTCKRLHCILPKIKHATFLPDELPGPLIGESLTVTCSTGFALSPNSNRLTCQNNRTFGLLPSCEDIDECEMNPCSPQSGTCNNTDGSFYCTCKEGYRLNEDRVTCEDINECTMNKGGCEVQCQNEIGDYRCDCSQKEGHVLFTEDGISNYTIPKKIETGRMYMDVFYIGHTCVRIQCPDPADIGNGYIMSHRSFNRYTDYIEYHCDVGFRPVGPKVLQCLKTGDWSGQPPVCQATTCSPASVPTGLINAPVLSSTDPVPYLGIVNMTCNVPGKGQSVKELKCVYNKDSDVYELQGPDYECGFIDCKTPPTVTGSTNNSPANTYYDSTYNFACKTLYVPSGSSGDDEGNYVVRCGADGRWHLGNLQCIGDRCGDPGIPVGGRLIAAGAENFEEGGSVAFACDNAGFDPSPVSSITCQLNNNGNDLEWNNSATIRCIDTESPRFLSCPQTLQVSRYSKLGNYLAVPTATDNFGIKSFTMEPKNANTTFVASDDLNVTFTATDYQGNTAECKVSVSIKDDEPPSFTCPVSRIVTITSKDDIETVTFKDDDIQVQSSDVTSIVIQPRTSTFSQAHIGTQQEVLVQVFDAAQNIAECKFYILVKAKVCSAIYLPAPENGIKTCQPKLGNTGYDCTFSCNEGYAFYDFEKTSVDVFCFGDGDWSTSVFPACVPLNVDVAVNAVSEIKYDETKVINMNQENCQAEYKSYIDSITPSVVNQLKNTCQQLTQASDDFVITMANITYKFVDQFFHATYSITVGPNTMDIEKRKTCANTINFIHTQSASSLESLQISGSTGVCPTVKGLPISQKVMNKCAPGDKLSNIDETEVCLRCPVGTRVTETGCEKCPIGFYQNQRGQTECNKCSTGTSTFREGSIRAVDCKPSCRPGLFSTTGLNEPCSQCPKNTYSDNSGQTQCTSCPTGTITVGTGSKSITDCKYACSKGQFSYNGFEPGCKACPKNFYQDLTNRDDCTECPNTQYTITEGSTSQSDCRNVAADFCKIETCDHGTCRDDVIPHTITCQCDKGYYGENCQFPINTCEPNPCFNGGVCQIDRLEAAGYTCNCLQGTSGDNCETDLVNNCSPDICEPNGVCINEVFRPRCYCKSSSTGDTCQEQTDICSPNPCVHGICENYDNVRMTCKCDAGYTGDTCEELKENCASGLCLYDGQCNNIVDGYSCSCKQPSVYTGQHCETRISPCANINCGLGGHCVDDHKTDQYRCICASGYAYGTVCQYELELSKKPQSSKILGTPLPSITAGECRQRCEVYNAFPTGCSGFLFNNTDSSCQLLYSHTGNDMYDTETMFYKRVCLQPEDDYWSPWYSLDSVIDGRDEEKRTDLKNYGISLCGNTEPIDVECRDKTMNISWSNTGDIFPDTCSLAGITCQGSEFNPCTDYEVRYKCAVNRVFSNNQCTPRSYCMFENPCKNGGMCFDQLGGYKCTCADGYIGSICQHWKDNCSPNPCKNGGQCTNAFNSSSCSCAGTGYTGKICQDPILQCTTNPCDSVGTVTNGCREVDGSYMCTCRPGFTGHNCSEDINECDSAPCLHGATCVNAENKFICHCTNAWTGNQCQDLKQTCPNTKCEFPGTDKCYNMYNFAYCKCVSNTYGSLCEHSPSPCKDIEQPCLNSGVCYIKDGQSSCSCIARYGGEGCEYIKDHCSNPDICKGRGKCVPSENSAGFMCQCDKGYSGDNCEEKKNDCEMPCSGNAQCIDGLDGNLCRCPLGKIGELCDRDLDTDYDLYMYLGDRTSSAHLPYSTLIQSETGVSMSMWVKFSDSRDDSEFFTVFSLPSQELRVERAYRLLSLHGKGLSVFFPEIEYTASFSFTSVLDKKWHNVVVTWDTEIGQIRLIMDSIRQDVINLPVVQGEDNVDGFYWIVLGSTYHPMYYPYKQGFRGYISQVNVYKRVLDFVEEIPHINREPRKTFPDLVVAWANFELYRGVEPVYHSNILAGSDPSSQFDKESPYTSNCPDDIYRYGTERLTVVSWTEPTFIGAETTRSNFRHGEAFIWGKYLVTYEAKDALGNAAFCSFRVFVQSDQCDAPEVSDEIHQRCDDENKLTECEIECKSPSKKLVQNHPNSYTCGVSGSWDPMERFRPTHYPSCGAIQGPAFKRIVVVIVYTISSTHCDGARSTFLILLKKTIENLNSDWGYALCGGSDCSLVTISINCETGSRQRRALETPSSANIVLPSARSIGTKDGESLTPEQIITRAVTELKLFNYEEIPQADADLEGFELSSKFSCPTGQTVIGADCVSCGTGTFYNSETATCDDCALGSYQSSFEATSCVKCGNGLTTETMGSSSSDQCKGICPPGQYFSSSCKSCPVGFYQENHGFFYCDPCPAGETTREIGANSASLCYADCPSGQELSVFGRCTNCSRGYYRTAAIQTVCEPCPPGLTTRITAAYSVDLCDMVACEPGNYWKADDNDPKGVCKQCGIGYYQNLRLQTSCHACAAQHRTDSLISTSEEDCKFYCPDGEEVSIRIDGSKHCEACKIGYYRSNTLDGYYGQCKACGDQLRTEATGSTSISDCSIFRCLAGSVPNEAQTECLLCPKGQYQPQADEKSCIHCGTGKSTRLMGAKSIDECEAICTAGFQKLATGCDKCPIGTYKNNDNDLFMECTKCPEFLVTEQEGSDYVTKCTVRNCSEGYKRKADESGCDICEKGSYQDEKYKKNCKPCPPGQSTKIAGATSNVCEGFCESGKEQVGPSCLKCQQGYYKDNLIDVFSECTICPPDYITSGEGATSAAECNERNCSAGQYRRVNDNTCQNCAIGFYQPEKWQTSCIQCPVHTTTEGTGSTNAEQCNLKCPAGKEDKGGVCKPCQQGFYKENEEATECTPCETGYTTAGEGSTVSSLCNIAACPPGKYLNKNANICQVCPYDQYQPAKWQESCNPCPSGYVTQYEGSDSVEDCVLNCFSGTEYNHDTKKCVACHRGYYREKEERSHINCQMCNAMYITPSIGARSSSDCHIRNCTTPGYYRNADKNECEQCPLGTYNSEKWKDECRDCPNTYTTPSIGSKDQDDCEPDCAAGYQLNQISKLCEPCRVGTYRNKAESRTCVICPNNRKTPSEGSVSRENCILSNCVAGYYGNNNGDCMKCDLDTYQSQDGQFNCEPCSTNKYTNAKGSDSENDCIDFCSTTRHSCSMNATCVSDASDDHHSCPCQANYQGEDVCIHKCDLGYCLNEGTCNRNSVTCLCSADFHGDRCESHRGGEEQSQQINQTIIIAVVSVFGFLLILVVIVVACCALHRRRQKKAKAQSPLMVHDPYFHDKASVYTRMSNAPYDNFTMMKPSTTQSLAGTQRMALGPMGEINYDNPAYGSTIGNDPAVYQA